MIHMKKNIFVFGIILLVFGCREEPQLWQPDSTEQVITEYIDSREEFSEFSQLLHSTGLNSLLSVRGPFTLFLPGNDVMQEYYQEIGVSSQEELSEEEKETLVLNHLVPALIGSGDFGLGAIREENSLGDYIVTEFQGADVIVNKESLVIDRDIFSANGVIHEIDKVLKPVTITVYDWLASNPSYSIFAQGLERTGLSDTLTTIEFPYGNGMARTRFTVLAVADTTYNRFGINSVDELIAQYTSAPDSIDYIENPFYRYMEYHCLGETYYLNTFDNAATLYPILSFDNNVLVQVDTDYKINYVSSTGEYTGFHVDQSNNPAKNGTIHTVDDMLPVTQPEPTTIVIETTDYFDLKQGDYFGKYYARWFDGLNTFEYIKWEGDYLLYYFKDHDTGKLLNDDCLSMSGWWWCEVTTPKIMKGKYTLYSNLWSGNISYAVIVDGEPSGLIDISDPAESTPWGTFDWKKTERHTIRVVAKSPGLLFWDTLIFEPA